MKQEVLVGREGLHQQAGQIYTKSFKLDLTEEADGVLSNEEQGLADVLGTNKETSVKCLKGVRVCSSKKVTWSIAHLKCLCTNAHSMGNKQDEL